MREKMNAYRILVGKREGKKPQADQDVGGWIILKWTRLIWLRVGANGGIL
jgi:hypothetical protein